MIRVKSRQKTEFGDFQTPSELADAVCHRLQTDGLRPASVVEPTCGQGFFLEAAAHRFPQARQLIGREWNADYVAAASLRLDHAHERLDLAQADFFQENWPRIIASLPGPVLVLGNPPWVTNSQLGSLGSGNLPVKSNFQNDRGIAAKTGKANFDISQWMITHLLESLAERGGTLAMLCKTAVARKVLLHAWKSALPLGKCSIREIDARRHFGAAVDACLLTCEVKPGVASQSCPVFPSLDASQPTTTLGLHEGNLLASRVLFDRYQHLLAAKPGRRWRSGIKHDCRDVMQFRREGRSLVNGLGEVVELEPDYLFPMLPAGAIFRGETKRNDQLVLVPQTHTGEDTGKIESTAPRTWAYLQKHAARLAARKSSIYRGRPPFSIFGIGEYSFAKWKVAISALHKSLAFRVVGPQEGRPTMLDDTTYFLSFRTRKEATAAANRLNSEEVRAFYEAWIFWDAKRPITSEILQRLA
ncbi:SAM-dependent methyltransferase [Blastopirellula marina]|uniref:SAM-dependent methyltransferase n=1 Tax=Blastopirellula marina TaxID=124 RepID=A0A2S8FH95_9BACT|nr:SAM-dependent methyltransferase [Blastopirellula marina]PQO31502.1 SAM-dependent methyltransferase [Blastopirellula marina]PTL42808.1 SAM-dependent methyltransferase [Blastopirellula marina]